jgi:hypothetical protein
MKKWIWILVIVMMSSMVIGEVSMNFLTKGFYGLQCYEWRYWFNKCGVRGG